MNLVFSLISVPGTLQLLTKLKYIDRSATSHSKRWIRASSVFLIYGTSEYGYFDTTQSDGIRKSDWPTICLIEYIICWYNKIDYPSMKNRLKTCRKVYIGYNSLIARWYPPLSFLRRWKLWCWCFSWVDVQMQWPIGWAYLVNRTGQIFSLAAGKWFFFHLKWWMAGRKNSYIRYYLRSVCHWLCIGIHFMVVISLGESLAMDTA